jgi:NAD(P)-dependent dehydrogenase (short-subunit alcohol dehydrogenase family)
MAADWQGKVVLVTGGAGGIGRATARRFLNEAATVFVADINPDVLTAAAEELERVHPSVHPLAVDITKVDDVGRMVKDVASQAGRLDVLVNAAGLWVEGPTEEMTEAMWDRTVDVNLKGLFFCCVAAIPELKKTGGCIVNLGSDTGVIGTPATAIYSASKGGVSLLTRSLALELAPHLVRVNAVCPADVKTPMLDYQAREYGGGDIEGYYKRLLGSYPQGEKARFVTPEEVAELIFYLASPAAAPITGALLNIDFGTTAGYGYE